MTRIAVVLSGCGFLDGAEITEAVSTLIALDRHGADWVAFAPDAPAADLVDHRLQKGGGEPRNIMTESARITRGRIEPLSTLDMGATRGSTAGIPAFDAIVFPGGFGVAKNLCNFAVAGPECTVLPELKNALREAHRLRKPIGAICIAPALVAAAFRGTSVAPLLTIGNDPGTAAALTAMGARHENCDVHQCVVDEANLIVSTPAYMFKPKASEAADAILALVRHVVRLAAR